MERDALSRTSRLLARLNRGNAACARAATRKLQEMYARGGVCFASAFDLAQQTTFLPLHSVIRTESASHSVRMTECPNSLYESKYGDISFNLTLQPLTTSQPRLFRTVVANIFSCATARGDISAMFTSVRLSYESPLRLLTFAYRSKGGKPTYVLEDAVSNQLVPIRKRFMTFGTQQAPGFAAFCL